MSIFIGTFLIENSINDVSKIIGLSFEMIIMMCVVLY